MSEAPACLLRFVARAVQVALGYDAKRADSRQHPAFRTVDLVDAVALPNQFAFWAPRQVEVSDEYVTSVVFLISVAFAGATATASADRKAPN
jgi:hypothetical protein